MDVGPTEQLPFLRGSPHHLRSGAQGRRVEELPKRVSETRSNWNLNDGAREPHITQSFQFLRVGTMVIFVAVGDSSLFVLCFFTCDYVHIIQQCSS